MARPLRMNSRVANELLRLCALGEEFANNEQFSDALGTYQKAAKLIPSPIEMWDATHWIYAAIGDVQFLTSQFAGAVESLHIAVATGALGNAFVHLRLGQCHYELGQLEAAGEELCRAYMADGTTVFDGEDPKYFAFLKTRIRV
ncbi:MAG: tetratricopeptide repeat protein [Planctomycetota bacterium]